MAVTMHIGSVTKIFVGTIEHKHGTNIYVARTKEDLMAQLAAFAREWWSEEAGSLPADDEEAVQHYFEHFGFDESYQWDQLVLK